MRDASAGTRRGGAAGPDASFQPRTGGGNPVCAGGGRTTLECTDSELVFTVQVRWSRMFLYIGLRLLPARTCLLDSRRGHSFPDSERSSRRGSQMSAQTCDGAARSPRSGAETDPDSKPCCQQRLTKAAIPNQPYLLAQCVNTTMTLDTLDVRWPAAGLASGYSNRHVEGLPTAAYEEEHVVAC